MKPKTGISPMVVLLLVVTLPYLLAYGLAGNNAVWGGFLLNPVDGNTYLAKMEQGAAGAWRFTLPYTAEPGQGAFLFLFYLGLGHLARLLYLPTLLVFHTARVGAAGAMALALLRFARRAFDGQPERVQSVAWLALLGSGMGWLVVFFGLLPADVWVAETYPFLSAYANPHFPLGMALLIELLGAAGCEGERSSPGRLGLLCLGSLALAFVQPFGIVVLGVVLAGLLIWQGVEQRRAGWLPAAAALAPGGLVLLYQYLAILGDPLLAGWNAQNLTPAPALWDFCLSLSPALPLAIYGGVRLWRARREAAINPALRAALIWALAGAALVYVPFPLQRRFLTGYYFPLALLAVIGVDELRAKLAPRGRRLGGLLLGLSLPSNLVILLLALFGVLSQAPELYLTRGEAQLLDWLKRETPPGALVLASPEMGLYIPAHSARRVIYGHPFETVNAKAEEAALIDLYAGKLSADALADFVTQRGVDYIVVGERERVSGVTPDFSGYRLVYDQDGQRVFASQSLP